MFGELKDGSRAVVREDSRCGVQSVGDIAGVMHEEHSRRSGRLDRTGFRSKEGRGGSS